MKNFAMKPFIHQPERDICQVANNQETADRVYLAIGGGSSN